MKYLILFAIAISIISCQSPTMTPATNQIVLPLEVVNVLRDTVKLDCTLITSGDKTYILKKDKGSKVYVASSFDNTNIDIESCILTIILVIIVICCIILIITN